MSARDLNSRRGAGWYAVGAFCVYVAVDIIHWALGGRAAGEAIVLGVVLPVYLLTICFVAASVALRAGRQPILKAAALTGGFVFAAWVAKIPLTLLLPGLVQRDHDGWAAGVTMEAVQVGLVAAVMAAIIGGTARLIAHATRRTAHADG